MNPSAPAPAEAASLPPTAAPRLRAAWSQAEALCIKCGFCLPACPTYRESGSEADSPRGRLDLMYAVAAGRLPLAAAERQVGLCLGCLGCETACPSGIRYHDMIDAARMDFAARIPRHGPRGWGRRLLLGSLTASPVLLRLAVAALALYQRSGLQAFLRATRVAWLIPPLARLERLMPPLGWPVSWRGALSQPPRGDAGEAVLLTGCVMDAAFGDVHRATVRVLARNGWRTAAPAGQGCCGALHLHAGEEHAAQALARRNIAAFESSGEAPILVNAAGCGALLKQYGRLLARDADWRERAARFSGRVRDVTEFLAGLKLAPPGTLPLTVAYSDPCHLAHAQQVREPPRALLAAIPGLRLVPLREADLCCGSAGSYSLTEPAMSARLLARKMDHIAASGAQAVATGNPGCMLQLRLGAAARGLRLRVAHPVELLADAYDRG
jgi:glycolate oxidase iron-sulfur subunit